MNGLILKVKRYLKKVVLDHYEHKYKDEDTKGRLLYLQELLELIDVKQLLANIRSVGEGEMLSTKFTDIKANSRSVVQVTQLLRDDKNIEPFIIKTDSTQKSLSAFLLTADNKYIDPKPYVQTILEYLPKFAEYVNAQREEETPVYLHNSYLLQFYVEDLITLTRELVRISIR